MCIRDSDTSLRVPHGAYGIIVDDMPAPTDVPDIKGVNPETEEEETLSLIHI